MIDNYYRLASLRQAFFCPRRENRKHMMRLVASMPTWNRYRCESCRYSFNHGKGSVA